MKKNDVTMVNPQQIVQKGLQGCCSTRTVTTFAQRHGVPCVWWNQTKTQKVLLVDWPTFRSTWNQYGNEKGSYSTPQSRTYGTRTYGTRSYSTPKVTMTKSVSRGIKSGSSSKTTRKPWSNTTTRAAGGRTSYATTRTTRRVRKAA